MGEGEMRAKIFYVLSFGLDEAQDSSKTTTGRRSEVATVKRGEAPKATTQGEAKRSPVKEKNTHSAKL